jgi:hypothetical protein
LLCRGMVAPGGEFPYALCYDQFISRYNRDVAAADDFEIAYAACLEPAAPFRCVEAMDRRTNDRRISSFRRLAQDFEPYARTVAAFNRIAGEDLVLGSQSAIEALAAMQMRSYDRARLVIVIDSVRPCRGEVVRLDQDRTRGWDREKAA